MGLCIYFMSHLFNSSEYEIHSEMDLTSLTYVLEVTLDSDMSGWEKKIASTKHLKNNGIIRYCNILFHMVH